MPPNCVSVTRPGKFGNPFETAEAFQAWIKRGEIYLSELKDRTLFPWTPHSKDRLTYLRQRILKNIGELTGKDLACFCSLDCECHADVLLEMANR
jgi:hypothetical protein